MSGTSLDGLDIALCEFIFDTKWHYKIVLAETIKFNDQLYSQLLTANELDGLGLMKLNHDFGVFIANQVNSFLLLNNIQKDTIDLIASHGQTVFHQPTLGFTTQIGCGATIAAITGINTVNDFRSLDVALGGQGAPLVPIGDELLYNEYDYCLNLGGIANVSFKNIDVRKSYDICFANIPANYLSNKLGESFDKDGHLAESGNFDQTLFNELNDWDYFEQVFPKSLGKESFDNHLKLILDNSTLPVQDQLNTLSKHIAFQVQRQITSGTCLITGGGAYNKFLISLFRQNSDVNWIIPEPLIIEFKEALIFAFLGVLRMEISHNALSSVTGASKNSVGGALYLGN